MEPILKIPRELANNGHEFADAFFKAHPLSPAPVNLQLPNGELRNYQFPTYFDDVQFSAGVFLCDYDAAVAQMPTPLLRPVSALGKRAMVVIASYQYRKIHEMKGYNEVLVMIPVLHKGFGIPILPPLIPNYPGAGYYIIGLPMTSLENQLRGKQFWGLPKELHTISIEDAVEGDSQLCETHIHSQDKLDLILRVPKHGKPTQSMQTNRVFSIKNNHLIEFKNCFSGTIQNTTNWKTLFGKTDLNRRNTQHSIEIGSTPLGSKLKALDINPTPFKTKYCNSLKSCLFLPDGITKNEN